VDFCPQVKNPLNPRIPPRLEQLAGQEVRREHKEDLAHALEAGVPTEAVLTIAKHRPNRATVDRSPSTVSFTVSLQNGLPLSSRSRRVKPHHVSCTIAGASARSSHRPWRLLSSVTAERSEREEAPIAVHVSTDGRD
jgi:hypothetical protein